VPRPRKPKAPPADATIARRLLHGPAPVYAMICLESGHRVIWDGADYAWDLDVHRPIARGPRVTLVQAPPHWLQRTPADRRAWVRDAVETVRQDRARRLAATTRTIRAIVGSDQVVVRDLAAVTRALAAGVLALRSDRRWTAASRRRNRTMLTAALLEGDASRQIATRHGVPVTRVRALIARAHAALKHPPHRGRLLAACVWPSAEPA